jgi:predicted  nucleic acid-binding Zn-ribbon protein
MATSCVAGSPVPRGACLTSKAPLRRGLFRLSMLPDLERLIRLQRLDTDTARAQTAIADMPAEVAALDGRITAQKDALAGIRSRLDENQRRRREIEKELAAVQSRLSRYKDQLMTVKTNKEYQAMQHEIATAEHEVRAMEDRILDGMEEAETLTAELKVAETALRSEQTAVDDEKRRLEALRASLEATIAEARANRAALVAEIGRPALELFELVARRRPGVVVAEARDGHCTECHVRLRPQHFNEVRRNDSLIQCETCMRILYYAGPSNDTVAADA